MRTPHKYRVSNETLPALREQGVQVRINHFRMVVELGETPSYEAKGGETHVRLTWPDGFEAVGVARCSNLDTYSKAIGRMIALGRALKAADEEGKLG